MTDKLAELFDGEKAKTTTLRDALRSLPGVTAKRADKIIAEVGIEGPRFLVAIDDADRARIVRAARK